jgi:hypothetical protein
MAKSQSTRKKKPCVRCMKMRWLVLYCACIALILVLFTHEYMQKGL